MSKKHKSKYYKIGPLEWQTEIFNHIRMVENELVAIQQLLGEHGMVFVEAMKELEKKKKSKFPNLERFIKDVESMS